LILPPAVQLFSELRSAVTVELK
jgi:uracil-DNA glycosylase